MVFSLQNTCFQLSRAPSGARIEIVGVSFSCLTLLHLGSAHNATSLSLPVSPGCGEHVRTLFGRGVGTQQVLSEA